MKERGPFATSRLHWQEIMVYLTRTPRQEFDQCQGPLDPRCLPL